MYTAMKSPQMLQPKIPSVETAFDPHNLHAHGTVPWGQDTSYPNKDTICMMLRMEELPLMAECLVNSADSMAEQQRK